MIEKSENEVRGKKRYVSVWLETCPLYRKDVITESLDDPMKDEDVPQDDIFG